jgi:hypothetical protein
MTITYEALLAEQAKHRAAFGWMLIRWRAANDWGIYGPARLAERRGFRAVPYGLWHQLERGLAGELQTSTFMALGELNQRARVPLGDWDGTTTIWTPMEFWACYCGLLPVPARWRQP